MQKRGRRKYPSVLFVSCFLFSNHLFLFRPKFGRSLVLLYTADGFAFLFFFPGVSPRAIDMMPFQGEKSFFFLLFPRG